jgi:signal transduction histidine kinase
VRLRYALAEPPSLELATVAYFVVSESVTNAVKHADANRIAIDVHREGAKIRVEISDDGCGGATIGAGGGLTGLARRVAAMDGDFTVHSPENGPTVVRVTLPCE